METTAWLILLFPLLGCVVIGVLFRVLPVRAAGIIGTLAIAAAFVASVLTTLSLQDRAEDQREVVFSAWDYAVTVGVDAKLSILVDPLSMFMALVVSGVSTLIHLYSVSYMASDRGYARFFAYLNFFVFSMLLLVLAGNFLILIIGWAFVGAASYLLISFWYRRTTATSAGIKAFVINVLGDVGLVLGTYFIFKHSGTLDFLQTFEGAEDAFGGGDGDLTAGCILLLVGAFAKSAQIPLHTWLPDAMEGPTPVSALIHAATMVTAGVYMLVRLHPIFEAAPEVQDLAAGIGAVTLLVAGLIALVQTDIKRVIAYSTMSQIGYMFLGAGLGAYVGGMFHLLTHAFFKALLFLAAGIVIHALAGEQDMRNMGGLRRFLPRTRLTFLVGSLALAGIPPLSGFWSKDSILGSALAEGWYGRTLLVAGLAGVFLTGLYTFRMFFLVFEGDVSPFAREHVHAHGHGEGPFSMTSVVAVLAVLAAVGGLIAIPGLWNLPLDWLGPVAEPLVEATALQDYIVSAISVALALAGIGVAWAIYGTGRLRIPRMAWLQRLFEKKFYFDEAYDLAFYRPAAATARGWSRFFERPVIQGSIDAVAGGTRRAGGTVSHAQTGLVRSYALALAFGVAVLVLVFVSVRQ